MDEQTGRIYKEDEVPEDRRKHMISIPHGDLGRVTKMNRKQRRAWAAEQRHEAKGGGRS